jgi:ABC-type lipoprotein release transport system permease subunit
MWESFWLGLVGLAGAALVTAGPYAYLARNGIDASSMTAGGGAEVAGVGFDPVLRVGIFPENLLIIALAIVVATMLAGVYPASRAGRVVPVESIKLV